MSVHIEGLRAICEGDLSALSPFQIRTRFERHLYGLMNEFSNSTLGASPTGLSRAHLLHFFEARREKGEAGCDVHSLRILQEMSDLFQEFTYLCDTSNLTDDGQDPRIQSCREGILALCDTAREMMLSHDANQKRLAENGLMQFT
jgi:hypothetical protein